MPTKQTWWNYFTFDTLRAMCNCLCSKQVDHNNTLWEGVLWPDATNLYIQLKLIFLFISKSLKPKLAETYVCKRKKSWLFPTIFSCLASKLLILTIWKLYHGWYDRVHMAGRGYVLSRWNGYSKSKYSLSAVSTLFNLVVARA